MQSERRLHPRVNTELPGELEVAGATYDVVIVNLSAGGFLIEGSGDLLRLSPPAGLAALEVDLHFGLIDTPVHCRCRIVYKRRQSYDKGALGLHTLSISDEGLAVIRDFVEQQFATC